MSLVELFAFQVLVEPDEGFALMTAEIEATYFPSFGSFAMAYFDAVVAFADFDSFDNFVVEFHSAEVELVDVAGAAGDNFDLQKEIHC